jgi:hypothetical protein
MAFDQSGHIFATLGGGIAEGVLSFGPTILSQPTFSISGQNATISVTATSLPYTLSYQWLLNGVPANYPNTDSTIDVPVNASTVGTYSVIVTGYGGPPPSGVISSGVTLSLTPPFSISGQPPSQAVASGTNATFSVTTSGTVAPTYQWIFNGAPITGATSSAYSISDVVVANSGAYTVMVTDQGNSVTSQPAFLTVTASSGGPSLSAQPKSLDIYPGETVVLTVVSSTAQSTNAVTPHVLPQATTVNYQWYFNGSVLSDGGGISGSQTPTLLLSGGTALPGSYVCIAENAAGSVLSQPAVLSFSGSLIPSRLVNVSCRAQVGTGADILISGFVIGGSESLGSVPVLVRASGPALVPFGVPGVLADPELQLYSTASTTSLIAENYGWAGASSISSAATEVGAFAWTSPSSHDAALVETLTSGAFTANVSGQSADSGVALAEVYDATPPGDYGIGSAHLVNVSARIMVGTGGNVLIVGFVIGGSTSKTVLIRASGPALKPFGVTGTLPDPELQLYQSGSGGTSTLLGANTSWGGNTQVATEATSVGAFSWGSSATADSALLVTLPPGAYTAQVSGASGDKGIALVEVYEVP